MSVTPTDEPDTITVPDGSSRDARTITYRWNIGPSTEEWAGKNGTRVAELRVYHYGYDKTLNATLSTLTVFEGGNTRRACDLTGRKGHWRRKVRVARYSAKELAYFAAKSLAELRAADAADIAFAFHVVSP